MTGSVPGVQVDDVTIKTRPTSLSRLVLLHLHRTSGTGRQSHLHSRSVLVSTMSYAAVASHNIAPQDHGALPDPGLLEGSHSTPSVAQEDDANVHGTRSLVTAGTHYRACSGD